eukprot:1056247-Rhodomonas_salina.5
MKSKQVAFDELDDSWREIRAMPCFHSYSFSDHADNSGFVDSKPIPTSSPSKLSTSGVGKSVLVCIRAPLVIALSSRIPAIYPRRCLVPLRIQGGFRTALLGPLGP